MLTSRIPNAATLAWLGLLLGGLLAAATLLADGWRGQGLPAGAVALVDEQPILRSDWLRAVNAVEEARGARLDAAGRAHVLQRLIDEELLYRHALDSGLVRQDPGLRKTVIAGLIDAASGVDRVDEAAALALFEQDPSYFAAQPRLRVAGLSLAADLPPPPPGELLRQLREDAVTAPAQKLILPTSPLPLPQLAQRLGGRAAEALRTAEVGRLIGPLGDGPQRIYLLVLERQADRPSYEQVAAAVRTEAARRQSEAALDALLQQLRRDTPARIAPDAKPDASPDARP